MSMDLEKPIGYLNGDYAIYQRLYHQSEFDSN